MEMSMGSIHWVDRRVKKAGWARQYLEQAASRYKFKQAREELARLSVTP